MSHDYATIERLVHRTEWLIKLRWVAAAGLAVTSVVVSSLLDIKVRVGPLLCIALLIVLYNALFLVYFRRIHAMSANEELHGHAVRFANVQISLDLVMLTLALHFSGGVENPFIMFYMFHVIIASILLPSKNSYALATLAVGLFSVMALVEHTWPSLHNHMHGYLPVEICQDKLLIIAEVVALGMTLYFAAYMASSIVSEVQRREEQLVEMRDSVAHRSEQLEEKNKELAILQDRKSQFMNLAAHQLISPLAAMDACVKTVHQGYVTDGEKRKEMLGRVLSRIEYMLHVVRDLLSLARARGGASEAERKSIPFDAIVEKVVCEQRPRAEAKDVELGLVKGAGDRLVNANERAIADVIVNLVVNAIKYTGSGGRVQVKTSSSPNSVHCRVMDTGIGIPRDEQHKLFQEFFRASNAKAAEVDGTGLGLAIVKEILTTHGGSVEYSSMAGLGTIFTVTLPALG